MVDVDGASAATLPLVASSGIGICKFQILDLIIGSMEPLAPRLKCLFGGNDSI